jgi:stage IV sporulation protein A
MPQSAGGKTITTTEPKFIPKEAAGISLNGAVDVSVRLIDCVGYMVEGAAGHMEEDTERMVRTPWFENEIPFTQAAEIGTDKVMNDHSTIGLVILTDGSFGEIPRANYLSAEEKTITGLKKIHKPFLVLLNSQKPYSEDTRKLSEEIGAKHGVSVLPVNCEQLKKDDIHMILENILYEFPISVIEFYMPKWVEMLPQDNRMKQDIISKVRDVMAEYSKVRDVVSKPVGLESDFVKRTKTDTVCMSDGAVKVMLEVDEAYYYEMLTEMIGESISDEYQLLGKLKEFASMKREYSKVLNAIGMVRMKGYGVVTPEKNEITLNTPELIKHGNKFGVKIRAISPSIHMIRANIETEIAPIVGTEDQAEDLIKYINNADTSEEGIWETNIFGKTIEQLVNDGITTKITAIGDDSQVKLQDTMQKIVNDSNGGMVCIII